MFWGSIRFGDAAIVLLVVMLGAFMWYQIKLTRRGFAKAAAKQPDDFLSEIRRQNELSVQQIQVLERIATALENPKL